jgi:hypothetical protein
VIGQRNVTLQGPGYEQLKEPGVGGNYPVLDRSEITGTLIDATRVTRNWVHRDCQY